jgi:hypothetical protein
MTEAADLYRDLKPELEGLVSPLFEFATDQVGKHDAFLPFGATLSTTGTIALVAVTEADDVASADDLLPLTISALSSAAGSADVNAVALCEWVRVGSNEEPTTDAIKVLVQHRRGLTIAFYLKANKPDGGAWQFTDMQVNPASPYVRAWSDAPAA